jgi:hypothetical protein
MIERSLLKTEGAKITTRIIKITLTTTIWLIIALSLRAILEVNLIKAEILDAMKEMAVSTRTMSTADLKTSGSGTWASPSASSTQTPVNTAIE